MIHNLHLLRAVAAAMVVVHHLRDGLAPAFAGIDRIVVGAAGVDIFFVVSGVVIARAAGQQGAPGSFLLRRAVRVVPMYWLALLTVGVMLMAGLAPLGVQTADATLGNMLRSMFFVPFERAHGAVMPLLGVGWTLNYEMFFYAVFACVMGVTRNRRALVLGAVMVLFVLSGPAVQPGGVVGAFYTNPILLEFAAGVGLAHLWALQPDRNRSDIALGAVVLSAGIALLIWHARTAGFAQLMPERAVIFGIPAVFCVAGAMLLERGGFAVKSPLVMVLGGASYALYLFHGLVLQCLDGVIRFVGVPVGTAQSAVGTAILAFVLCHLIAIILHVRVERPLTALLRGGMARVRMA